MACRKPLLVALIRMVLPVPAFRAAVGLTLIILAGNAAAIVSVSGDERWSSEFTTDGGVPYEMVGGSDLAAQVRFSVTVYGSFVWRESTWRPLEMMSLLNYSGPYVCGLERHGAQLNGILRFRPLDDYHSVQFWHCAWGGDGTVMELAVLVPQLHGQFSIAPIFSVDDRLFGTQAGIVYDATAPDCWVPFAAIEGGSVTSMTSWSGRLTMAGSFIAVGGVPARQLARLGPNGWEEVGGGVVGIYPVAAAWNGSLFVAGELTIAGTTPVSNIAAFDGATWQTMLGGVDGRVRSVLAIPGGLLVAGEFHSAGGQPAQHIALWNGEGWQALGSGTNGDVLSLAWYDGRAYVGGDFTEAGGKIALHLSTWTPLVVPTFVQSFAATRLEDGGVRVTWEFAEPAAEGLRLERADMDGVWRVLAEVAAGRTGFDWLDAVAPVQPLVYRLRLAAQEGGEGTVLAEARVAGCPPAATRLLPPVPNPFNPSVTLRFTLERAGSARLAIHDARGRSVRVLLDDTLPAGMHAIAWDGLDERGAARSSGVYVARLTTDSHVESVKLNLVR